MFLLLFLIISMVQGAIILNNSNSGVEHLVASLIEEVHDRYDHCMLIVGHDYAVLPAPIQAMLGGHRLVLSIQWTPETPPPTPNRGPPHDQDFEYWFSWLDRPTARRVSSNCALVAILFRSVDHFQPLVQHLASTILLHTASDKFLFWSPESDAVRKVMQDSLSSTFLYQLGVEDDGAGSLVLLSNCHFCQRGEQDLITIGHYRCKIIPSDLEVYPDYTKNLQGKHLNGSFPFDSTPGEVRYLVDNFLPVLPYLLFYVDIGEAINFSWHLESVPEEEGVDPEMQLPDGNWTGMMSLVVSKKADFAVGRHGHLSSRVSDWPQPHIITYMSFIRRASRPLYSWRPVIQPYTPGMWALILSAMVACSFLLYLILRVLSHILHATRPARSLMSYSYRLVFSTLVEQHPDLYPSASSARVFIACWWIFSMVIICGYDARLIGFLAKPDMEVLPNDFKELLAHPSWQWGIIGFMKPYYRMLVQESEYSYHHEITPKLRDGGSMLQCMTRTLEEDFSCFGMMELLVAMSHQYMDLEGRFASKISDESSLFVFGGLVFPKHSIITPIANRMVLYSGSAGLLVRHDEYFKYTCMLMGMKDARNENRSYKYSLALHLSQLKGPIAFLVLFYALALACFLGELFHFRTAKK